MIVVLDMRDGHPAGDFVAYVEIEGLGHLEVRGRTSKDARRTACHYERELRPKWLGIF